MTTRPYERVRSTVDLRATADRLGSKFFTADAMRFFDSRLTSIHRSTGPDSGVFVTSERYGGDAPRMYAVRTYQLERIEDDHGPKDSISFETIARMNTRQHAEIVADLLAALSGPDTLSVIAARVEALAGGMV